MHGGFPVYSRSVGCLLSLSIVTVYCTVYCTVYTLSVALSIEPSIALSIHCLLTAYAVLFISVAPPIHCLPSLSIPLSVTLSIHCLLRCLFRCLWYCLFTVCSLLTHCLFISIALWIHCLFHIYLRSVLFTLVWQNTTEE
jgi:hypothetical protein